MQAPAIHLWTGASISELQYAFDVVIKAYGFIQTYREACIYKKVSGSSVAFLILYVDDILLIGNDIEFLDSIKGYLNKNFSMKDLGEAAYILGIKRRFNSIREKGQGWRHRNLQNTYESECIRHID